MPSSRFQHTDANLNFVAQELRIPIDAAIAQLRGVEPLAPQPIFESNIFEGEPPIRILADPETSEVVIHGTMGLCVRIAAYYQETYGYESSRRGGTLRIKVKP